MREMRKILFSLIIMLSMASSLPMAQPTPDPTGALAIIVGPAGITYQTRRGDTLMSIAQQWSSRAENWMAIAKINHIDKDSNIPIGTQIVIPAALLADEPSQAQVETVSGNVTAHAADGKSIAMQIGAKLNEGALIETGVDGFLSMSLPDASRISLPSNSRVKLSKLRMARYTKSPRTELTLLRGHVESRVAPLDVNQGSYEVHTPSSVAGVRGTQFRVGMDGALVTNEVLSGKVAVGDAKHPADLTLGAGQGNIVDGKGVGPEIDLLPAPQLDRAVNEGHFQITLLPVPGARSYHVQIANDPDALDVLAENRSSSPHVKFTNLAEGSYFARVSAIDKNGLEGLATIQAISFHPALGARAAVTIQNLAPYVDASDDKTVTLRWRAQSAKAFNVQVARDAQFSWLIFNATTDKPEARLPRPAFGTYYTRVQTVNPDGSVYPFSATQTFIVTDHWVINDGGPANAKRNPASADHS
jgi:hypothetical protein